MYTEHADFDLFGQVMAVPLQHMAVVDMEEVTVEDMATHLVVGVSPRGGRHTPYCPGEKRTRLAQSRTRLQFDISHYGVFGFFYDWFPIRLPYL